MAIRMRSVLLGVVALVIALVVAAVTAVGWEVVLGPNYRATADRPFEVTEARLARGKYLAEGPAHCFFCHTEHDMANPEFPILQARKGAGWHMPIPELGVLSARNITPDKETGLGNWTDDEIARAIREGVRKDGTPLFPVMPYPAFAEMSDEDVQSIVVYLRTLTPIRNTPAERELIFPLSVLVNTMPKPLTGPMPAHTASTPVERGGYLVKLATCEGCHTRSVDGQALAGMNFAGGEQFPDPNFPQGKVYSANITPDPSGIAHYDEKLFIELIRTGRMGGRTVSHIMPFEFFRNITDQDLGDMFAFIKSRPPFKHRISNTDPPTPCPLCKHSHGLGNLNTAAGGN